MPTPETDPMMRPRSPRPTHPSTTQQRSRLRAATQLQPTNEPRLLNYIYFPTLADELHENIEAGYSLDNPDSDSDSDYELPPQNIHREGKQLPAWRNKWYKEGEQNAARELAIYLKPSPTDHEDWYGWVVEPKPESEPEPEPEEDDADLDSPSRQLQLELSQYSQSESQLQSRSQAQSQSQSQLQSQPKSEAARVDDHDDDSVPHAQPIVTPVHEEVFLWATQDPTPVPATPLDVSELSCRDGELALERVHGHKRKRTAQEKLLRRMKGKYVPC